LTQEASDVPIDPYKGPRFSQTTLAIDAAIAGQGIALASTALIERDVADGRLCRLFDATLSLPWQYYIVRPDESRCPDAVAALCRWLLAQRKG
jgi:LysR family glycine cleavage system transcriptional activator